MWIYYVLYNMTSSMRAKTSSPMTNFFRHGVSFLPVRGEIPSYTYIHNTCINVKKNTIDGSNSNFSLGTVTLRHFPFTAVTSRKFNSRIRHIPNITPLYYYQYDFIIHLITNPH